MPFITYICYLEFVRKTTGAIGTGIGVNKKSGKTTD
jgi:hypothetical protein